MIQLKQMSIQTIFIIDKSYNNIPVGVPIGNVKCYVVDGILNLLLVGAIGELCIGGESLASGYINQVSLTEDKFISNHFQSEEEEIKHTNDRLYKTGDMIRWLPNGNLEYIGRSDSQVKIRGFRI
jgi:non-ribosomal peptide synthetase component F